MNRHDLAEMTKGWFIGPFTPTCIQTNDFECAVKAYKQGDKEARHYHKIAKEYTVIVTGTVRMNGIEYGANSIVEIMPGESTDFEAVEDAITFVVKVPAVPGDKYEC
jgi:mannose-6-phosphate isomerase-like protein (cupin superfamily)